MPTKNKGRVLFYGQCYYNNWYLSRELRNLGWKADLVNFDDSDLNREMYYHGQDIQFYYLGWKGLLNTPYRLLFYLKIIFRYDIICFSNRRGIGYFWEAYTILRRLKIDRFIPPALRLLDIRLLKFFGKKIVYVNNGCNDGVLQSTWSSFNPSPCDSCVWKITGNKVACSDETNTSWGKLRNELSDCQFLLGGYTYDFNKDAKILESPEAYCLDHNFWRPDLMIPTNYRLFFQKEVVKIYHAVGNLETRSSGNNMVNVKSTHIYLPIIERLKKEGLNVELIFLHNVPNKFVRYYQLQADIVVDMLTFGCYGANVREAMMLGKPVVCYMRPEFLENIKKQLPEYIEELPIINATPESVYDVLKDLVLNPDKRLEIGRRSREFAVKWHSAENAAKRMERVYLELLKN